MDAIAARLLESALKYDLGHGDVTSERLFGSDLEINAAVVVKDERLARKTGVLAGAEEFGFLAESIGSIKFSSGKDGSGIKKGDRVVSLKGSAKNILSIERTGLNIMCRMSGIATETKWLMEKSGLKIAATRKSPPNCTYFDKKAVELGGGLSHRKGLWDSVLVKDNHLAILRKHLGFEKDALAEAVKRCDGGEIEVTNMREAVAAANAGAKTIMLDNFSPADAKMAVKTLGKLGKFKIELSGGITPENIKRYSRTGADYVSLGYLTHSIKVIDMSLDVG